MTADPTEPVVEKIVKLHHPQKEFDVCRRMRQMIDPEEVEHVCECPTLQGHVVVSPIRRLMLAFINQRYFSVSLSRLRHLRSYYSIDRRGGVALVGLAGVAVRRAGTVIVVPFR